MSVECNVVEYFKNFVEYIKSKKKQLLNYVGWTGSEKQIICNNSWNLKCEFNMLSFFKVSIYIAIKAPKPANPTTYLSEVVKTTKMTVFRCILDFCQDALLG